MDLLIVAVGAAVVLFAGTALTGDSKDAQGALGFVIIGWALYYFFATESGEGQTVGKKLMKLRVVRADGRPAGMAEIAVRTILRVVDNYLVGLIVMLATGDRRQRIGDLAAGTIVVDASAAAVAPPAPAADVVEDAEEDEQAPEAATSDPVATKTITLPSRPAPPATVGDLAEPEADEPEDAMETPAVPEMRPFPPETEEPVVEAEPVEDEPVAEEPVVEAELVEDEPVAEEPVVEAEPVPAPPAVEVQEDDLPPVMTPSLEELAQDVAAAHAEPDAEEVDADEDAPEDDGPVTVTSVETVSAIDLVMGGVSEEDSSESSSESDQDAQDPASQ